MTVRCETPTEIEPNNYHVTQLPDHPNSVFVHAAYIPVTDIHAVFLGWLF